MDQKVYALHAELNAAKKRLENAGLAMSRLAREVRDLSHGPYGGDMRFPHDLYTELVGADAEWKAASDEFLAACTAFATDRT